MSMDNIKQSYINLKRDFDKQAEREGVALQKQGRYKQSRWYYIKEQTEDYNTQQIDKLFKRKR